MSDNDNDTGKTAGKGWTDREKANNPFHYGVDIFVNTLQLLYLFALIESTSKPDFAKTPRPNGRSLIACQRMYDRLKGTLKVDLEALKAGQAISGDADDDKVKTPKITKSPKTPKRKAKNLDDDVPADVSPKKRSRKKSEIETPVKEEIKGEEGTLGAEI